MSLINFKGPKRREGQPLVEWLKETRLSTRRPTRPSPSYSF